VISAHALVAQGNVAAAVPDPNLQIAL
jgi:hypothetical protein